MNDQERRLSILEAEITTVKARLLSIEQGRFAVSNTAPAIHNVVASHARAIEALSEIADDAVREKVLAHLK